MISTSFTNNKRKQLKIYGIIGALLTLIIPFLLTFQNDHNHLDHAQSLCPFKMLTGFPCPGCGITKSLVYIYEGDLSRSLHFHLFGSFVFVICIVAIVILSVELFTGKSYFRSWVYSKKLAYSLAFVLVGYHLIRLYFFITENSFDDILKQSVWK